MSGKASTQTQAGVISKHYLQTTQLYLQRLILLPGQTQWVTEYP